MHSIYESFAKSEHQIDINLRGLFPKSSKLSPVNIKSPQTLGETCDSQTKNHHKNLKERNFRVLKRKKNTMRF